MNRLNQLNQLIDRSFLIILALLAVISIRDLPPGMALLMVMVGIADDRRRQSATEHAIERDKKLNEILDEVVRLRKSMPMTQIVSPQENEPRCG